jgi:hypothetical protein
MDKFPLVGRSYSEGLPFFTPEDRPYGLTYGHWTVKWWQWFLSIPRENNPAFDDIGKNAGIAQNDYPVWFLAGTFVGAEIPHRVCSLPENKAILFPTINYEANFMQDPMFNSEEKLKKHVKGDVDDIVHNLCVVDGMEFPVYRLMSDPALFAVNIAEGIPYTVGGADNLATNEKPASTLAVSDGYWVFLKPLGLGKHELYFRGSCAGGRRKTEAFYDITVT